METKDYLSLVKECKSDEEFSAFIEQVYGNAKEETNEKFKESQRNSVGWMVSVLGEIDQLLEKHDLKICVASGIHFDDDENGKVRVQLTIGNK